MPTGWSGLVGTYTGVAVLAVAAMPLVVLAVWVVVRLRVVRGRPPEAAWRTTVAEAGILYGTLPWVWMTLLPGSRAGEVTGAVSLVPFRDLPTMSTGQVLGNLVILAAFGWFAPRRFGVLASLTRVTVVAAVLSAGIETAQYVLRLDRVSSVDDVILNAGGAAIAAALSLASARLASARAARAQRQERVTSRVR